MFFLICFKSVLFIDFNLTNEPNHQTMDLNKKNLQNPSLNFEAKLINKMTLLRIFLFK